jgi:hypothetical protein
MAGCGSEVRSLSRPVLKAVAFCFVVRAANAGSLGLSRVYLGGRSGWSVRYGKRHPRIQPKNLDRSEHRQAAAVAEPLMQMWERDTR